MAYCDIDDVQGLNSQRGAYGATTKPTLAQVNEFIDQVYETMNTVILGRGISTVPVTVPASFVTALKLANSQGAAALAEMAMFPEAAGTPGGSPHGQRLWSMYQNFLKWLRTGDLPTSVDGHVPPRSFFEDRAAAETKPKADHEWQRPQLPKDKEF